MIMGHEFAGTVEQVGMSVKGLQPGQPVAVFPYTSCGTCACCREGATARCPGKRMFGVFDVNGGMAEYVRVPCRPADSPAGRGRKWPTPRWPSP